MVDLLAVASIPCTSGFPKDDVVNTFAFHSEGADTATAAADIAGAIEAFYKNVPGGVANSIGQHLSTTVSRAANACTIDVYNITGKLAADPVTHKTPSHGSPIHTRAFTMAGAISNDAVPRQVASVITLRARAALTEPVELPGGPGDPAPTIRPRERRTGRLFLGPFNALAVNTGAGVEATPSAGFRAVALAACENLQDTLAGQAHIWCVWSRTGGSLHGIERVEMDDSFDVIRSRKSAPTARTVRTFAPVPDLALGA